MILTLFYNITNNIIDMYDLKSFRQAFGLTQKNIADIFECGQANISSMEKSMRDLEPDQYKKLCAHFDVESVDRFKISDSSKDIKSKNLDPQISFSEGVPYYNVDFIGGFDIVLNDQTAKPEYLIDFKKYNEATCWCNVTGHSMEPEITHGDIIALKKIEDKSFLPLGEVYAIVTTNGMRTIKRLGPSQDPKCYTLVPTNKSPEYGIQEIPKDMIEHIFQVLGCMKRL